MTYSHKTNPGAATSSAAQPGHFIKPLVIAGGGLVATLATIFMAASLPTWLAVAPGLVFAFGIAFWVWSGNGGGADEEQDRIRQALETCQTNVMIADADYNIVFMNETMSEVMLEAESDIREQLTSFDARTLLGSNIDIFHQNPSYQRSILDRLHKPHNTKLDIGKRAFGLIASPVFDNSRQRIGTIVEWEDRTAQEKELQDQARAFAEGESKLAALDRVQAVIEFEPDGTIITANENFCDAMGYSLKEIQGQHHSMFADPEFAASAEYRDFWKKLGKGEFEAGEFRRLAKGGRDIWIQASYNPIFDENGDVYKVVKYATDITEEKFRTADMTSQIDAISKSQAVIEFELDGTIITANENFCATTGYTLDEIRGRHHSMFVDRDLAASTEYQEFWAKLGRGEYDAGEYERVGRNGEQILIQASYNPIFDLNGKPYKVVKYATDLTKSERMRENARIRSALDNTTTNVMVADADFNIVYMNESQTEMMRDNEQDLRKALRDFSVDKLIGSNMDVFHANPAHQRQMLENLTSTHKAEITVAGRIFGLIATPVIDANGHRQGVVVEWEDRTEEVARLKEEADLAAENARIRSALDMTTTNVMVADAEFNIVYMNESQNTMMRDAEADLKKELSNFDAANLMGQNIDVFHKNPAHQRGLLATLSSAYETDIKVGGRSFHLIASPVRNDEGERIGTVVEWKDETAEKMIEGEIQDVVAAVGAGDFSKNIDLTGKSGFMLGMAESINTLAGTVSSVLDDVGQMLEALSAGDLTQRIDTDYAGVFGQLKDNANITASKLGETVQAISTAAREVSSGAEEITMGATDLSTRTEQQAANLEETAASMQEMASTIKQNADNSQQASQLAITARDSAETGGQVVGNAVEAMGKIEDSSRRISDIIGVIDEIAFQTNLLALNAAVEAARAGDAGRGFAVVASEVRSLAQRSAQAAKDIKDLIVDSTEQVQGGVELVNKTGESLTDIVDSIKRVADIVAEISAASREQATGVDEINTAVTQMDEMTQQNSALVEENAAAAKTMSDQASRMRRRMAFFKSGGEEIFEEEEPVMLATGTGPAVPSRGARGLQVSLKEQVIEDDDDWSEF